MNISNLSALSEVIRCLAITPDAGITSKLCRFLDAPTQRMLDELKEDLWMVCDSLAIDEFSEFGQGLLRNNGLLT